MMHRGHRILSVRHAGVTVTAAPPAFSQGRIIDGSNRTTGAAGRLWTQAAHEGENHLADRPENGGWLARASPRNVRTLQLARGRCDCGRDAGRPAPPAQIRTGPLRHPAPPLGALVTIHFGQLFNYLDKVGKVTFAGSWPSILAYLARRSVGFFSQPSIWSRSLRHTALPPGFIFPFGSQITPL